EGLAVGRRRRRLRRQRPTRHQKKEGGQNAGADDAFGLLHGALLGIRRAAWGCALCISELLARALWNAKKARKNRALSFMVRKRGFEPPRPCGHKLLRLARLPVPPLPHEEGTLDRLESSIIPDDGRSRDPTTCSTILPRFQQERNACDP